ncbi:hypothetical protein C1N91_00195 [Curtobacterium sp. SGAir0471]|nr:hypothetical protein C1N91_00195 [Curtobacterium sp. SGAir0471]
MSGSDQEGIRPLSKEAPTDTAHDRAPRRRILPTVLVTAAVLVVGTGAAVGVHLEHAAEVARRLPPANATSEQVLRVYLHAAEAHDCAVTEALTAADASGTPGQSWCGQRQPTSWFDEHPDLLAHRNIGAVERIPADERGGVAEECIPVDVTETNMTGAEPGTLRGWQFCFHHTEDGWRLSDEGYG